MDSFTLVAKKLPPKVLVRYLLLSGIKLADYSWFNILAATIDRNLIPPGIKDHKAYYLIRHNLISGRLMMNTNGVEKMINPRVSRIQSSGRVFAADDEKGTIVYNKQGPIRSFFQQLQVYNLERNAFAPKFPRLENTTYLIGEDRESPKKKRSLTGMICTSTDATLEKMYAIAPTHRFIDLSNGPKHLVFFTDKKTAYVVGDNSHNHLPISGKWINQLTPLPIPEDTIQVIAGHLLTFALTNDGGLSVMGFFQPFMFNAVKQDDHKPTTWYRLKLPPIIKIAHSQKRTILLTGDGQVWGWGFLGTKIERIWNGDSMIPDPTMLYNFEPVVDIDLGDNRIIFLTSTGVLHIIEFSIADNLTFPFNLLAVSRSINNVLSARIYQASVIYLLNE